jgi:hypothetical protein
MDARTAMTDGMHRVTARGSGLAWACALGVLLWAAPATAQSNAPTLEVESYQIPGWSFTPSLALGASFDSNVALSSPRADIGRTEGDTLFTIVPGGQLEFHNRRTDFGAAYRGFVRRYSDVDGLDGYDQRASIDLHRMIKRRLTVFARSIYNDSPTTDDVELNGVLFRRTGSRTNTAAAGGEYRISKYLTLDTRYDGTWVEFDRPDILLTGGWIHGIRNELNYRVSRHLSVGGEYGYRHASLDKRTREFDFQDAGAVAHLVLGPSTRANAAVGFASMKDRNLHETRTGPYMRLGIDHTIDAATVGASFERRFVPSFGFGGASNSQELRGYVNMPLRQRRFYTRGSAAWRRSLPFELDALQLDTIWLRSSFGYTASRWMRVEADYTFTRQDSVVTGGEVDRHRIGVQFVISQPMRIQ